MSDVKKLYLNSEEAAQALGISPRTLWTLTKQGIIPCIRLNRLVRYAVDALQQLGKSKPEGVHHD
jgi:hypothetical protein